MLLDVSEIEGLKAFGDKIGVSPTYVWLILKGSRRPSKPVADRLEQVTGIPAPAWIWPEKYGNHLMEQYQERGGMKRV